MPLNRVRKAGRGGKIKAGLWADGIEGVRAMIRKMERQAEAFYRSEHYGKDCVPDIGSEINIETPPVKVEG